MGRKPFNVSGPGTGLPHPPKQTGIKADAAQERADEDGLTLVEAGAEVMAPDGEDSAVQEAPSDPGGRPVYAPSIPWGKANNGHKPFKV